MKLATIVILSTTFTISAIGAEEKERNATIEQLPAPAQQAIEKASGGEKLQNLSKESDEGKTVYEAKFEKNGRAHEVSVDAAGNVVSEEEVIPLAEAPEAVRKAIEQTAGEAKIEKLEKETENGKVTFEALLSGKGKRQEIVISPDGKILESEDETQDHEDKD